MANKIQFRRDTAANWTSANPTLSQGELGFETDTNKFKLGTGSTAWNSLDYTFNPSITANQNLNTTSNVTFANVTVPSTVTVDRLAKFGAGLSNIEISEDDNLTPQTDLRSDLGISNKRYGNAYINTATVSTKLVFGDASQQTTAWTGSVSTGSVTGLSTVGYTGLYSDLTGKPNQALDTTSAVTFAGVTTLSPINLQGTTTATTIMTVGQTSGANIADNWQTVDVNMNSGASFRMITVGAASNAIRVDASGVGGTVFKVRRKRTDAAFASLDQVGSNLAWNLIDSTNTSTDYLRFDARWSTTGNHYIDLQSSNNDFSTNTRISRSQIGRMSLGNTSGTTKFTLTNSVSNSPSIELGAGSTATIAVTGPMQFAVYTVAGKPASGAVGSVISISNSTPGGMLAFWDTTNNRWSYVHDNSAV
jgi:hypothetical protein